MGIAELPLKRQAASHDSAGIIAVLGTQAGSDQIGAGDSESAARGEEYSSNACCNSIGQHRTIA